MTATSWYLESFLAPLSSVLARRDVSDIYVNRPGELWVETVGGSIEQHEVPALDEKTLARLSRQIAAASAQGVGRSNPLLAASLTDGSRVQVVSPPATRAGHVMAIRRHVAAGLKVGDFVRTDAESSPPLVLTPEDEWRYVELPLNEAGAQLADAARSRHNVLISGGTSTGKTTLLNAMLREIPQEERLILIEDTPELELSHRNAVGLLAARSALSESGVTAEDLLIAALRMRPDRIILGELRGNEAFTFLRAVNTGHPGSMTTIHADTPQRAIDQLALLVLQSGSRLSWDDVRRYVRSSIDVFVQLGRRAGKRQITQVLVRA